MNVRISSLIMLFMIAGILLVSGALPALRGAPQEELKTHSLAQLEQRAAAIDAELDQLAHYSLRSGVGSIGYRSDAHPDPAHMEWVRLDLEQETSIDQVVLVPAIWRNAKAGFEADGFPVQFQVIAGTTHDSEGTVLASFSKEDHLLPRIAPLIVPCMTTASWVRVEASVLSARQFDRQYNLELAEIMVFSGEENVALHQPVAISSSGYVEGGARKRAFLVDGFVPYLMDAGRGMPTIAFVGVAVTGEQPSILIDLESTASLSRVHLHAMDFNDTTPQATPAGYGLPGWLLVEGAQKADFSDAVRLSEYRRQSIYDAGPIITRHFPETPCRYVRLTAREPYIFDEEPKRESRMGFAEIELFSRGTNAALHAPASLQGLDSPGRSPASLTDGNNLYGRILSTRDWMEELALRHKLERERPLLTAELAHRYARQKVTLRRLGWLAALLTVGIGFTFLIDRMRHLRDMTRLKERFAADLHDELGANLHTIGLLSDLSRESIDSPEKLDGLLNRIHDFTDRSAAAARYCTNMLESEGLCEDLVVELKQSSARLLADLDYEITFSGEDLLHKLTPRKRIDLFLFNKECLINILRHSGASRASIHLAADPKTVCLTITDNGTGIKSDQNGVPSSIKRRARLLGAQVAVDHPPEGGTRITLTLKTSTFGAIK